MAAFLEGLFGSASEEENKNKDVRGQYRRGLLNHKGTLNEKEMKAAKKILAMKKTQPEYSQKQTLDAGQHMAVDRYNKKDGEPPSSRKQRNRRKLLSGKKSTSRESLNTRTLGGDNDMSKLSHKFDSGTKLKTIISDLEEGKPYAKYDDKKQRVSMGGKRTRKRRRKRKIKTKRKGRRKTKKRRNVRKRKTKRRR